MPNMTTREIKLKTSVKQALLCLENKLQTSWGNQRENNDKRPIKGEFRAMYNNKIKTI